jgi:hypothetical protein
MVLLLFRLLFLLCLLSIKAAALNIISAITALLADITAALQTPALCSG